MINETHRDALTEIINIGIGRGASLLNELLDTPITLHIPEIKIISQSQFYQEVKIAREDQIAKVDLPFSGSFAGVSELVFPTPDASKLVSLITRQEVGSPDWDVLRSGTLAEIGNMVLNSVMGTLGNILKIEVAYGLPNFAEGTFGNLHQELNDNEEAVIFLGRTNFSIEALSIEGNILLIFSLKSFDELKKGLDKLL